MQGAWSRALPWRRFTQTILTYAHDTKFYTLYIIIVHWWLCCSSCKSLCAFEIPALRRKTMGAYSINSFIQVSCKHIWANGEIRHRLWEKSATDFGEIRHWIAGNLSLILGRCVTGFVKLRFWEKNVPFLGWTGSVRFWDKWLRFGENRRSLGEKKLVRFLDWLGQSSSFTVLNAKHVWVCNF